MVQRSNICGIVMVDSIGIILVFSALLGSTRYAGCIQFDWIAAALVYALFHNLITMFATLSLV